MGHCVHYEDDIFFLNEQIRLLLRNLKLHLDSTYFADKIHQDLLFYDNMLSQFYRSLTANQVVVDRLQNLRLLNKTKRLFCNLLDSIVSGHIAEHLDLSSHFDEYTSTLVRQEEEIREIRSLLNEIISQEEPEELISSEEYKFLFDDTL
ncbi:MAG: hypothetical protein ACOC2P_01500 [Spirochaetota bacterium]